MKPIVWLNISIVVCISALVLIPAVNAAGSNLDPLALIAKLNFDDSQIKHSISDGFNLLPGNVTPSVNRADVSSGSTIYHHNGITRVFDSNGKQISIIDDTKSTKVATPVGFSPATNVYHVPNGALIRQRGAVTQVIVNNETISTIINTQAENYQFVPEAGYGDWVEEANNTAISNLGRFSADWIAPNPPSNTSMRSTNFLFNGIEPQQPLPNMTTIIQPVLEWNNGGTHEWRARPWYITNDGGIYNTKEDYIRVTPGDSITGLMDWNNDTQNWTVIITDNTRSLSLHIDDDKFWSNDLKVTCAFEGYNLVDNSDLPGSTYFTNMEFKDTNGQPVYFNWDKWYNATAYSSFKGLFVDTLSQSQVTLYTDKQYTLTPSAGSGGNITPASPVQVLAGASQTFTITPAAGYSIADVVVDGGSQGAVSSYTFTNVQHNSTISATFFRYGWNWSIDGWGDWQHTASWSGGSGSEYGPVMVDDSEGNHGEHGTDINLNAGSTQSSVWKTFTDPSGTGWNTITFKGQMQATDTLRGRWMTIDINNDQVFGATALESPPGYNAPFEITRSFDQSSTVTVKISNGQKPAWRPRFAMHFYSVTLSNENTSMMNTRSAPSSMAKTTFKIPDGSEWKGNTTSSNLSVSR